MIRMMIVQDRLKKKKIMYHRKNREELIPTPVIQEINNKDMPKDQGKRS